MKTKTKSITKIATLATACVLVASLSTTSIFASAASTSSNGRYYSDYTSQEMAEEESEKFNKELASEGIVMLKNDGSLPVAKGSKVSVLGIAQDCMAETSGSITESLADAGLTVNPTLEDFYTTDSASSSDFGTETELNSTLKQSLRLYNDVGIVVIARGGAGESSNRSTAISEYDDETYLGEDSGWTHEAHSNDGNGNDYKHELQLTDSEQELIALAEQYCDKVVVMYSAAHTFEMANLQDDDNINGIYWIGRLGDGGIDAVGEILTGEINPSGKVVDEWTRDFTNDPTYANATTSTYGSSGYSGIDYEEDIYLGYKYYETYWYEASQSDSTLSPKISGVTATAKEWYDYNVVYPMGYGLSYTDFSFELVSLKDNNNKDIGTTISASDLSSSASGGSANITSLSAEVKVTNTGDYAGKETVQVYITAPYTSGETEKAYLTLAGYVKTSEIAAGSSETVTVTFNVQDFASYDYTDANNDNHKGYELDTGTYTVHIMDSSSHNNIGTAAYASQTFTISGDIAAHLDLDDYTGNVVGNLFSKENGDFYSMASADDAGSMVLLSREDFDGTAPTAPTSDQLTLSSTQLAAIAKYEYIDADYIDDSQYPWYKTSSDIPSTWTQGAGVVGTDGMYAITLDDMAGVDLYDSNGNISTSWVTFINQLTWDEIAVLLNDGYHLTESLSTIGKLETNDENGPNYTWNGITWCCEPTVAATWNVELAEEYGRMAANNALWQDMTGWYGPGINTHRNQFNGRAAEYYSQDSIQGGNIAVAVVQGATSTGINVYIKHFALYDSSIFAAGIANCSEQNMRENYLKIFQMCMQEGGATACMTSVNRIGGVYSGENYNLIQKLARDEWGWDGFFVTDIAIMITTATVDGLIRAGADIPDGDLTSSSYSYTSGETTISDVKGLSGTWDATNNCVLVNGVASPTQWYCARMAVTRLLYNCANSAANYNGVTDTSINTTITATQGVSVSESVIPEKYTAEDAGYTLACTITSGELPAGLTIENGVLTGTPTTSGTYNLTMEVTVDYWISIQLNLTIEVASVIGMEDNQDISSLSVGDDVDCYVDFDSTKTEIAYTSFTYSIYDGELPDGLSISSDGRITGTATTAGTYTFTVCVNCVYGDEYTVNPTYASAVASNMETYGLTTISEYIEYLQSNGQSVFVNLYFTRNSGTDYYYTYTIEVTGEEVVVTETATVENIVLNSDGDLEITFSDGTTTTLDITTAAESDYVTDITTDSDGNIVVTFTDGTSKTVEITSEGSGCSGSISANIITVVVMLAVAGAAVVVIRKKRAEK